MRLQAIDESANFSCGSCTACCDQPWRTLIEEDKVPALDAYDFGAYPQLVGRQFYRKTKHVPPGFYELAKGEGNKCLFLDTDRLCIIHKELGGSAKPHMCRQFPFIPSRTPTEDRVSVNYGCPSVRDRRGTPLSEQADEIRRLIEAGNDPADSEAMVKLAGTIELSMAESEALHDRAMQIFDPGRDQDIWQRFAELMGLLMWVGRHQQTAGESADSASLVDRLSSDQPLPDMAEVPPICAYDKVTDIPMPAKMLFAATLYPDAVGQGSTQSMSFGQRLTLIPKLMSLATLSGTYASRLLGCNVCVREVMRHKLHDQLGDDSTELLRRYFRSRFWQRTAIAKQLSIATGVHQHILDFNAIIFFARVAAHHDGADRLSPAMVRNALTMVEFHLANQYRLYHKTLKGWLRAQLGNPQVALASLRMMALKKAPQDHAETPAADTAATPAHG